MRTRPTTLALAALIAICGAGQASAQTNPCTAPLPPGVTLNPTTVLATLTEQNATQADGTPTVTEYLLGYFASGVDPNVGSPVQSMTIPKASWNLLAGTTDCYSLSPLIINNVPVVGQFVAHLKAKRTTAGNVAESGWSGVSNLFGRSAVPVVTGRPVLRP